MVWSFMAQAVPLATAKAQLAGLVQAAETGQVVHISRRGKPVAVLLSEQAYQALMPQGAAATLWRGISNWRNAGQADATDDWPLGPHADEPEQWRDRSAGRCLELG
jgi:prevent-host-death family protein